MPVLALSILALLPLALLGLRAEPNYRATDDPRIHYYLKVHYLAGTALKAFHQCRALKVVQRRGNCWRDR